MESLPLHHCKVHRRTAIINRSHALFHFIGLAAMFYYRVSSPKTTLLPWLLVFASELVLSLLWLLNIAFTWRPVSRTVFPERLPADHGLPAVDVFICTADPKKEPPVDVMNTVLSAMSLDYPPGKLFVYLSDDAGSSLTLYSIRVAWTFAKSWVPFCRKYRIKILCPTAYFSTPDDEGNDHGGDSVFKQEKREMEMKYEQFSSQLRRRGAADEENHNGLPSSTVEVIGGYGQADGMPLLVYLSREKKPSHPHHFKAGALNVLVLRVSGIISNSPYILVLDCDMYSNDPTSARQAMCFHLDPLLSPSLAFVQFPQRFHNLIKNDIYDGGLRTVFEVKWPGMDGLRGPMLSGTCFYIKRKALYGVDAGSDMDVLHLRHDFGPSNEFNKSVSEAYKSKAFDKDEEALKGLTKETKSLANCTFEEGTEWGLKVGFLYRSVLEDYFTGFNLHCRAWVSVFCNPSRPAFLGTATTNLNDSLIQATRWNSGLLHVCLSRFCPIIYGLSSRLSLLQCMCYASLAFQPFYSFSIWCLSVIPSLCLLNGVSIYPKAFSGWFFVFSFVSLSPLMKSLWDVLGTGGTIQKMWNEWRAWMTKSAVAYFYGCLNGVLELMGAKKADFSPTNKIAEDEQFKRYQMGIYDFQTSTKLLAPLATLVLINMACFSGGVVRLIAGGGWSEMAGQLLLSFFVLAVNYPLIEGMMLRKDKGRVPFSVTLLSVWFTIITLFLGSVSLRHVSDDAN